MPDIRYFGIRHHGPGSALALVAALEALQPETVLIEGPSDASGLLPLLGSPDMVTPVALLSYPKDAPQEARFYPFAEFSPEYQAVLWAMRNGAAMRFIDLPSAWSLPEDAQPAQPPERLRDPIGMLAHAAGYEDGESWWRELVEENPDPGPVFDAVADAMGALREDEGPLSPREAAREAHMRLEIRKTSKDASGPVAVVCGAFHVPALRAKHTAKADREAIRAGAARKTLSTWAPWTSPRLAFASGYGAGVESPAWCRHVWRTQDGNLATPWLARIARPLREQGQIVSTASIIEAERLALTLTAMRGRSAPGFEELREAAIACLCFGERLLWDMIAPDILIGQEVGAIPDDVPLAPLLEDLARQQKRARLKPESLERELSIDLRSEAGAFRSTLLHRLTILGVPWGRLTDSGRSRGTFRERWALSWEPEFAVQLVENLVFGPTIEGAASGRLRAGLADVPSLTALSETVLDALRAQLPEAADAGIAHLARRAARSGDGQDMLGALAPLSTVLRYGQARETDMDSLAALFDQMAVQASLGLGYSARNLNAEMAAEMRRAVMAADNAIRLLERGSDVVERWVSALRGLLHDAQAARLLVGTAAQLLYGADEMDAEAAGTLLQRFLSPGTETADAAAFFEGFFAGFFAGNGARMIYDAVLRSAVDDWLTSLPGDSFTETLPLLRRVFSTLDGAERARLLDALFGRKAAGLPALALVENADTVWARHVVRVSDILTGAPA